MDLWCVHGKSGSIKGSPSLLRNSVAERPINSWSSRKASCGSLRISGLGIVEVKVSKKKAFSSIFVVRAMGGKRNSGSSSSNSSSSSSGNGDQSVPEGHSQKGKDPSSERNKSRDSASEPSHPKPLDWREFRARLYIQEQAQIVVSESCKPEIPAHSPKSLPQKWAHPISAPEDGCLLVATEKLDGHHAFERTVVLLLRSGTNPQEGPYGVVINRPLHKKIKHMEPTNLDLATIFADCSLHFGGPLKSSLFLLRSGGLPQHHGFEEVIPGVCFVARNSLDEACQLVKKGVLSLDDFRFFVGHAGWEVDQLKGEIEKDYWYVAACSANLVFGASQTSSSESLWQEILQLMGDPYSEVSRKPKQDS